jgi:hypothetical protein
MNLIAGLITGVIHGENMKKLQIFDIPIYKLSLEF